MVKNKRVFAIGLAAMMTFGSAFSVGAHPFSGNKDTKEVITLGRFQVLVGSNEKYQFSTLGVPASTPDEVVQLLRGVLSNQTEGEKSVADAIETGAPGSSKRPEDWSANAWNRLIVRATVAALVRNCATLAAGDNYGAFVLWCSLLERSGWNDARVIEHLSLLCESEDGPAMFRLGAAPLVPQGLEEAVAMVRELLDCSEPEAAAVIRGELERVFAIFEKRVADDGDLPPDDDIVYTVVGNKAALRAMKVYLMNLLAFFEKTSYGSAFATKTQSDDSGLLEKFLQGVQPGAPGFQILDAIDNLA